MRRPAKRSGCLPQSFYRRDAEIVAKELLGAWLAVEDGVSPGIVLRIVETEAYLGPHDSACHSKVGRTQRTAPMFGPPGRAYVYLCYGIHNLFNIVTGSNEGAAVLIRGCEVVAGAPRVAARRGGRDRDALAGPGKVGAALGVDPSWSNHPLYRPGGIAVRRGPAPAVIKAGARVGIDSALPRDRDALLRFAVAGSRGVSVPKGLRDALHREVR